MEFLLGSIYYLFFLLLIRIVLFERKYQIIIGFRWREYLADKLSEIPADEFFYLRIFFRREAIEVVSFVQHLLDFITEHLANPVLPGEFLVLVMTGIQRYYIEEVDIVVEDEKGVAVEQAVVEMLGVEALLFPVG